MDKNDAIKSLIDEFMNNASEEEVLEFAALLKKREKEQAFLGRMDLQGMASDSIEELKKRVGINSEGISKMARKIVANMILNYDPEIDEETLYVLLDKWVPDRVNRWKQLPRDMQEAMISQFVAYGRGEISEKGLESFPEGWAEKYWSFFPDDLQGMLRAYIKGEIGKKEFWSSAGNYLS